MKITDFSQDPYLSLLRPLVEAYLAFHRAAIRHIASVGLTSSQFDVLVQLGDTEGVICADLSKSTLITKGTLTGVIDRLEAKGLVTRESVGGDRRAIRARLTTTGQTLFKRVFPAHAEFLRPYFKNALSQEDIAIMKTALLRLRDSFEENKSPKDTSTKRPK